MNLWTLAGIRVQRMHYTRHRIACTHAPTTHSLRQSARPISWISFLLEIQELHTNQEAVLSGFDDEGFSAIVTLTSSMESATSDVQSVPTGSMKTWLVRGMVSAAVLDQLSCSIGVGGTEVESLAGGGRTLEASA